MNGLLAHLDAWAGLLALVAVVLSGGALVWVAALRRRVRLVTPDMRRFVREMKGKSFEEATGALLGVLQQNAQSLGHLGVRTDHLERVQQRCVQKVGCVRYDADDEMGGAVSFALALLDGNLNGIILTSVHTFSECRLYMRPVAQGHCALPLNPEEQQALDEAKQHGGEREQPRTVVQPGPGAKRGRRSRKGA